MKPLNHLQFSQDHHTLLITFYGTSFGNCYTVRDNSQNIQMQFSYTELIKYNTHGSEIVESKFHFKKEPYAWMADVSGRGTKTASGCGVMQGVACSGDDA